MFFTSRDQAAGSCEARPGTVVAEGDVVSGRILLESFRPQVARVEFDEAERFWSASPQSTPFTRPVILERLCQRVDWWLAKVRGRAICLWPVCHRLDGRIEAPEFSYYVGPFWSAAVDAGSRRYQIMVRAAAISALASMMVREYGGFSIELPPGETDVRPFRWWASDVGLESVLNISPQYTGVIDLATSRDEALLLAGFSRTRRMAALRHLKEARVVPAVATIGDVERLYRNLAERLGNDALFTARAEELGALVDLVERGHGFIEAVAVPGARCVSGLRLMIGSGDRVCGVLSLAEDTAREDDVYALLAFKAIRRAQEAGACVFDFNGANGFARIGDVHGYGAVTELYFAIECRP